MSDEYRSADGVNASLLKYFAGDDFNPAVALHKMRNPMTPSPSMALGTAVHSILENEMDTEEAYDIISGAYKGEKPRTEWFEKACSMAQNVWDTCADVVQHPEAVREKAYFNDGFKALIDISVGSAGADFKSTRVTTLKDCIYEAHKWNLEIQAYHYCKLGGFDSFEFIFVSSVAPHQVFRLSCSDEYMDMFARPRWEQALERYMKYKDQEVEICETGSLSIPGWYQIDASEVNWG